MAFIVFKDRTAKTVSLQSAKEMQAVMNGTLVGSDKQKEYVQRIHKIYLGEKGREEQPVAIQSRLPYKE